MSIVIKRNKIEEILSDLDLVKLMEEAFCAYSSGEAIIPPVGEMVFEDPPGEMHIKYGYIRGGDYYVVKVASGFYNNPRIGLSSSQGVVLLFCLNTGGLKGVFLDEGVLTNQRTAAAGAVCAKYLAPVDLLGIGIIGGGIQARLQLMELKNIVSCRKVFLWTLNPEESNSFLDDFAEEEFDIEVKTSIPDVCRSSQLIVTATPSKKPLIHPEYISPGTHITAVGSDTPAKNELEAGVLGMANLVVVDSYKESRQRGEVFKSIQNGLSLGNRVIELGKVVKDRSLGRKRAEDITVADLTGLAVQDLKIAEGVWEKINNGGV